MSSRNIFPREIFKSIRGRGGDRMPVKKAAPKKAVKKAAAKKPAAKAKVAKKK